MKLLVTGGLGFIGSNFILKLLKQSNEFEIINIDAELHGADKNNLLEIEVSGNNMKEKHQLNIFVNAPPVISYRPDNQETILQNDSLLFQLQSFDMNTTPQLSWSLLETNIPNNITLSNTGKLSIYSDSLLDNYLQN